MSKPIIKAEINDNTPTIGVNVPDGNVPILPVETVGGDTPIDLRTLTISSSSTHFEYNVVGDYAWNKVVGDVDPITGYLDVTENGVYNASDEPYSFYGFSTVTVNVPPSLPNEYLESEWNLLISTPTYGYNDIVKKVALPTNRYRSFSNGFFNNANGFINLNLANCGDIKRFVVQMGEFDRSQEPTTQYLGLFSFAYGTNGQTIIFDTTNNVWRVRDAAAHVDTISTDVLPKYAFDGALVEVVYGAKYINGELFRGRIDNGISTSFQNNTTVYVHATNNETYVIEFTFPLNGDRPDYMFTCRIGVGSNDWLGAKYENAKIYNVLNCYDKFYDTTNQRAVKVNPELKNEEVK